MAQTDGEDWKIRLLRVLQKIEVQRKDFGDFAREMGMTFPTFTKRRRQLERAGLIRGYTAIVDPVKLGFEVTAFIAIELRSQSVRAPVIEALQTIAAVQEVHTVYGSGNYDLLAKVRGRTIADIEAIQSHFGEMTTVVRRVSVFVVGRTEKETT